MAAVKWFKVLEIQRQFRMQRTHPFSISEIWRSTEDAPASSYRRRISSVSRSGREASENIWIQSFSLRRKSPTTLDFSRGLLGTIREPQALYGQRQTA
jgi:hypothetical protein